MSEANYVCFVVRRQKYITLVVQHREGAEKGAHLALTLHRVEMDKLVNSLRTAIDSPLPPSAVLENYGGVEGVSVGGPPAAQEIGEAE